MNYQLIRSKRKTLSLSINDKAELVIRAPERMADKDIQAFIVEKSHWIEKKQQLVGAQNKEKHRFENDEKFLFLGNNYALVIRSTNKRLSFNGEVFEAGNESANTFSFERWYKQKFREIAVPRIDYFAKRHNLRFNALRLKKQKTLWGSCSSNNNLNFNYLLIMAPMSVIDYVIVHELAHTVHKNHSSEFWGLVESILPDYKPANKWLKENGYKLKRL